MNTAEKLYQEFSEMKEEIRQLKSERDIYRHTLFRALYFTESKSLPLAQISGTDVQEDQAYQRAQKTCAIQIGGEQVILSEGSKQ